MNRPTTKKRIELMKMNHTVIMWALSRLLAAFTTLHAAETTATQPIDRETLDKRVGAVLGFQCRALLVEY